MLSFRMTRANAQFEQVGTAFVQHYYQTFDAGIASKNFAGLAGLYQPDSMFTWEGNKMQGAQAIVTHLAGLPFQQVAHQIVTMDCQPTTGNGILVFVCGNLKVDQEANTVKYSQSFVLLPTAAGGWYVQNDIFRLNYG